MTAQNVLVLSSQVLQFYSIHVNYDTNMIAFDGQNIIDFTPPSGLSTVAIILIIAGVIVVIGGLVVFCIIKKKRALAAELNTYN